MIRNEEKLALFRLLHVKIGKGFWYSNIQGILLKINLSLLEWYGWTYASVGVFVLSTLYLASINSVLNFVNVISFDKLTNFFEFFLIL